MAPGERKWQPQPGAQREPAALVDALAVYVLVGAGPDGGRDAVTITRQALAGGATAIQFRSKDELPVREQIAVAQRLLALCRQAGALFFVNDRLDVALAVGADGLHVGQQDLPVAAVRRLAGPHLIIGCSVDDGRQAQAAQADGADYLGVGPIYGTGSKDDAGAAVGTEHLRQIKQATTLPLVGIGGITTAGAPAVIQAGAAGVAVISAVTAAPDVKAATQQLAAAVQTARDTGGGPASYPTVAGEFGLIDRLAALLPPPTTALVGIGDDAAVLPDAQGQPAYVTACDLLVEGIHFHRGAVPPEQLGWKSLAVNVSDCGAMGARPRWAVIGLAVPPHWSPWDLEGLYTGLAQAARQWQVDIVGGDTTRSHHDLVINVTIIGELAGQPVLRRGAQPGHLIGVTGDLGAPAAGLALYEARAAGHEPTVHQTYADAAQAAWHKPVPPVAAGVELAAAGLVSAMIDVSDGLAADLHHLLQPVRPEQQTLGAQLTAQAIPVAPAARSLALDLEADALAWALHGGEEYELLFTLPPANAGAVTAVLEALAVPWTVIGTVTEKPGLQLLDSSGRQQTIPPAGWDHFK